MRDERSLSTTKNSYKVKTNETKNEVEYEEDANSSFFNTLLSKARLILEEE